MVNDCPSTTLSFADATFLSTTLVEFIVEDGYSYKTVDISATDTESFASGTLLNGYDFCGNREYTVTTISSQLKFESGGTPASATGVLSSCTTTCTLSIKALDSSTIMKESTTITISVKLV